MNTPARPQVFTGDAGPKALTDETDRPPRSA